MATEKQIQANRRNGALSRGPKTAAGKGRSRYNALKHGFAAQIAPDPEKVQEIDTFTRMLGQDDSPGAARMIAESEIELRHIRRYQADLENCLLSAVKVGSISDSETSGILDKLLKSGRYERRACAKRKRAFRKMMENE